MSELSPAGTPPIQPPTGPPTLFAPKPSGDRDSPIAAWAIAGLVVLLLVAALVFSSRSKSAGGANTIQPPDPYAASLPLSGLAMSESTNLSGGKYTYIDGHVQNTGSRTVTAITVQVLFHNEEQMPPHVETLPLALIRTHQPYVDIQPIAAAPLGPGDEREFRLTFETIPGNWNTQMPDIHVVRVSVR